MLTSFGKFCRKLRVENGKLLLDMAKQLGVSSAYLSKVENGKARPRKEWLDIIAREYCLGKDDVHELKKAISEARRSKVLDMSELSEDDRDMMLAFARKLDTMDMKETDRLKKLLKG